MTIMLYSFIFIIQILLSIFLYHNNLNKIFVCIGYTIFSILVLSYSLTIFKDPGIPKLKYNFLSKDKQISLRSNNLNDGYLTCKVCNVYVPQETKIGHCLTCKICIIGYDHHCGWSSKCIGKGNILYFWIFFATIVLFIIYNFVCIICIHTSDFFKN